MRTHVIAFTKQRNNAINYILIREPTCALALRTSVKSTRGIYLLLLFPCESIITLSESDWDDERVLGSVQAADNLADKRSSPPSEAADADKRSHLFYSVEGVDAGSPNPLGSHYAHLAFASQDNHLYSKWAWEPASKDAWPIWWC